MRVERALPGQALQRFRANGDWPIDQSLLTIYYLAGEMVSPGRYFCTFCGSEAAVHVARPLSLCPTCDSSEYIMVYESRA